MGSLFLGRWFDDLDAHLFAKVALRHYTDLEEGNFSMSGLLVKAYTRDYKIDFGGGYRIYFGQDGKSLSS